MLAGGLADVRHARRRPEQRAIELEQVRGGANILDGRYAVFGYVIKNADVLADLKPGDVIQSVRVTDGAHRLAAARAEEFA